jgi:predicted RNase H-like HicB family nuclease
MNYDVILSKKDNKYSARIKKWPEIEACENTRDEAIQQVKTQLLEYLTQQEVEVVQIEIPLPTKTDNRKAPTPKGLNMKRSNLLREIIATDETCGSGNG